MTDSIQTGMLCARPTPQMVRRAPSTRATVQSGRNRAEFDSIVFPVSINHVLSYFSLFSVIWT